MSPWILAARPKTLVAGFVPVMLGSALAYLEGGFQTGIFLAALGGALAIQIGANYVNDAADFERGADTEERLGPPRMAATGALSPKSLYKGAGTAFVVAFLCGLYLILAAGLGILWIGIASILFAIAYTAGPFPLAYLGLGDLFVLLFFGLVAVVGTVFAHLQIIPQEAWILAFCTGLQGMALIAVNNLRDIPTDLKAGKKTISLRLGDKAARYYYALLVFLPYLLWGAMVVKPFGPYIYLPYLSLPLALLNARLCFRVEDRRLFNKVLGLTAALQLLFGILAALSLVCSR